MKRSGDKHLPEDIFRDKLHDLEINPPERSWQGIQSRMAIRNQGMSKKRALMAVPLLFLAALTAVLWLHDGSFNNVNIEVVATTHDGIIQLQKPEPRQFQDELTESFTASAMEERETVAIPLIEKSTYPEIIFTRIEQQPIKKATLKETLLLSREDMIIAEMKPLPDYSISADPVIDYKESKWQLSAYGGGILNHRVISANEESSQLKDLRNDIEAPAFSYNAGISLSKRLNKRIRVETGLEYIIFTTRFNGKQYQYAYHADQYSGASVEMGLSKNTLAERSIYDLSADNNKAARVTYLAIPLKMNYFLENFYIGAGLTAYQVIGGEAYFMHPKDIGQYSNYEIKKTMLAAGINAGIEKNFRYRSNHLIAFIEPEIRMAMTSQFDQNFSPEYSNSTNMNVSDKTSRQYPLMSGIKAGLRVNI